MNGGSAGVGFQKFNTLLVSQLTEATEEGDLHDIIHLAGLLARRVDEDHVALIQAAAWIEDNQDELEEEWEDSSLVMEELVNAVGSLDLDAEPEVALCHLMFLDEHLAGATWLGRVEEFAEEADLARRLVRIGAPLWKAHSKMARQVLHLAPPLDGDPMTAIWEAVADAPQTEEDLNKIDGKPVPEWLRDLIRDHVYDDEE